MSWPRRSHLDCVGTRIGRMGLWGGRQCDVYQWSPRRPGYPSARPRSLATCRWQPGTGGCSRSAPRTRSTRWNKHVSYSMTLHASLIDACIFCEYMQSATIFLACTKNANLWEWLDIFVRPVSDLSIVLIDRLWCFCITFYCRWC